VGEDPGHDVTEGKAGPDVAGLVAVDGRLARLESAIAAQQEALGRIEGALARLAAAPPIAPVVVRVAPVAAPIAQEALPGRVEAPRASMGVAAAQIAPTGLPGPGGAPGSIAPAEALPPAAPIAPAFDLESWFGGAWLNRIGVILLVFGVAFFIKHAFDAGWIGPAGKVMTGLAFGAALVLGGERGIARGLRGFGQGLVGGGFAIVFVSLYASFHIFALVSQTTAFACMAATTAATVALALRHDAQPIAVMGLLGGFLTPALLSTGRDEQAFLFSYILLLDLALLAVALARSWTVLNHLVFLATQAVLAGWSARHGAPANAWTTIAFACAYGAVFAATPLVRALRLRDGPGPVGLGLAVVNAGATFGWVMALLAFTHERSLQGTATLLFAGAYSVQAALARGLSGADRRLHDVLVFLAISFAAIFVPIELEGPTVPLAWAAQATALLLVGARRGSAPLMLGAGLLHTLALVMVPAVDMDRFLSGDGWRAWTFLANPRGAFYAAMTGFVFASAVIARSRPAGAAPDEERALGSAALSGAYHFVGHVLALALLLTETHFAFEREIAPGVFGGERLALESARQFALSTVTGLYGAGLVVGGFVRDAAVARWAGLLLLAVTVGKVFIVDLQRLETIWRVLAFMALGAALVFVSFLYQRREKAAQDAGAAPLTPGA